MTDSTVRDLLAGGVVATGPHATDGRKVLSRLTEAGQALLMAERRRTDRLAAAIDELPARTRAEVADRAALLNRLTERIRRSSPPR